MDVAECHLRGRPLDKSRDVAILEATLELLGEHGYDRLTMDGVAARAQAGKATVYRRWGSKAALVIDAVASLHCGTDVADTGSLAGDLWAMAHDNQDPSYEGLRARVMAGLVSAMHYDPELKAGFDAEFVAPRVEQMRRIFTRAVARGEVPPGRDLDPLMTLMPALFSFRLVVNGQPVDDAFLRQVIDQIVVPLATAPERADEILPAPVG
jgi:AcrR family transcriptional regulator